MSDQSIWFPTRYMDKGRHRMSTKKYLAVAASALLATLLAACGGSGSEDDKTLTVTMWGGGAQKANVDSYFKPWAEQAGVTIKQDSPTDYAKLKTQAQSGPVSGGVIEGEPNFTGTGCEGGPWA